MKKFLQTILVLSIILATYTGVFAQGVTTSSMKGVITDQNGEGLPGATVLAVHVPSGTQYGTATQADGSFNIPSMRVGGPYKITVTFVGFKDQSKENIYLTLGTGANVNFSLSSTDVELTEVQVTSQRNDVFSSDRTGAATNLSRETINSLPTLSRSINDFTRLTPQASGRSFAGQDNRFNNITVDGSVFNNSFGLQGQPGDRTGVTPISLDAIEEVQVNLAPYDVRQGGFTGAGVNAVTRSGTNEFSGSVFYNIQGKDLVGKKARGTDVPVTNFANTQVGFRIGGPILKNKLFFFVNGEFERRSEPATSFLAQRPGQTTGGNITRVLASDLDQFSAFLRTNFNYETGPYEGYNNDTRSDKILVKFDYNISRNHKFSIRYNFLNSSADILASNSNSLGFGNRRTNLQALNFRNTNYIQNEDIHSVIGELNSTFGNGKFSNNLIAGYTFQGEDRGSLGTFFPLIEIQSGGQTYISAGFEPFTPFNQLSYKTYQLQDNFTYYGKKHTITAGFNIERFSFRNVFFPGSQGVYVFNSLQNFYDAANAYVADPTLAVSPVSIRRFQLRYSALPGGAEPVQPTKVWYTGFYLQDQITVNSRLNVTAGVRIDIPFFDKTGFRNAEVEKYAFRDENGSPYSIRTDKLPDARILWSPRIGFNWDVFGNKTTQVRGGTGIFTGRPPFVWISNQIGNNGVLTGFIEQDNTTAFPFRPNPFSPLSQGGFVPNTATLPTQFELAATDPNFKFPQIWRTNIAVDQKLPWGLVGTLEFIYNKNVNAVYYIDANRELAASNSFFAGADNRPRFPGIGLSGANLNTAVRIVDGVTNVVTPSYPINLANAVVLRNTNKGYTYSFTAQVEKQFSEGWFAKVAYNFGVAKDLLSAGSIAAGSWTGIRSINGNNRPDLAFSDNDQRHRIIGAVSYRKEYAKFMASQISLFTEARNQGRFTYTYNLDMNGDGVNGNDLLYIPRSTTDANQIVFLPIAASGANPAISVEDQQAAFEKYIAQDKYLSSRRGQYTERNGAILPWVATLDLAFQQEFFIKAGEKRNTLQVRLDIFNFTNMLNNDWGVFRSVINTSPLVATNSVDASGRPQFRMATTTINNVRVLLPASTYRFNNNISDTWRMQIGIRYIFN
jgi:outer membrane receptor protein involved in Fe transport